MARRIVIVDDDAQFRRLVRMVLDGAPEFEVVGEAATVRDGLAAARLLQPDAVLLDVNLPDGNGFELTPQLTAQTPPPSVVITSSRGDATYGRLAVDAGAVGFVSKHELSPTALVELLA